MDYSVFDDKKQKEYRRQAKEKWGTTEAYKEFEGKNMTDKDMKERGIEMMGFFAELGKLRDLSPDDARVQSVIYGLRTFISENFYNCTKEIFSGLGMMYSAGGEMTDNINKYGGEGTAEFVSKAIEIYCKEI